MKRRRDREQRVIERGERLSVASQIQDPSDRSDRSERSSAKPVAKLRLRKLFVATGEWLPDGIVRKLGNLFKEVELRQWLKRHGLTMEKAVSRREELFEMAGREIENVPTLYVEFGVAKGEATRAWSKLLKHPSTVLHGFDSFEGLPEHWTDGRPQGMFSTGGALPSIGDPRVRFFKGWFHETLPAYEPPKRDVAVINMDADLYSSTILALRALKGVFTTGTYLYFDEFCSLGHEERAFREFVDETGLQFALRGSTPDLMHVLFQCTGRNSS